MSGVEMHKTKKNPIYRVETWEDGHPEDPPSEYFFLTRKEAALYIWQRVRCFESEFAVKAESKLHRLIPEPNDIDYLHYIKTFGDLLVSVGVWNINVEKIYLWKSRKFD